MRYNDAEEKSFDWQLEKSYKRKIRGQNFSNKLSYPDKLTIITMNDGKRRMTIKEWMEVDPETYEVRADGELLTCRPAEVLPLAQRYFLF